jgi:hypothetical protein
VAYTYDEIFAKDGSNPEVVAQDATITIFDPADPEKNPVPIFDVTGSPLPNPITVNSAGMGPAFYSETLDRVGWFGAGFQNYLTSYEGMRTEAQAAKTAAQSAAANAAAAASEALAGSAGAATAAATSASTAASAAAGSATSAAAALAAAQAAQDAAEEAAAATQGGGFAVDPSNPSVLLITTLDDGTVAVDPTNPNVLLITT